MAPKKAPIEDQAILSGGDAELDQAIDDLRGVLQSDATGTTPASDFGMDFATTSTVGETSDFGSTFSAETDLSSFGGDFGASNSFADLTQTSAAPSFDAGSFGETTFGGGTFEDQPAGEPGSGMTANLDLIMDIPIDVQIVLGTSRMQVSGLMNLTEGATIALDRRIGEPVEIVVNGRVIGRGEITVLDEDETRFGVKLIEIKGTRKV
ncbi:flagellar motor switch protein FliN [Rhizobium sp. Root73]|uniref:flagellar motor switch protein FliN n=1 Tax=unclassified Rhizobium TaxID=2613769 RepID=UPI000728ECD5|nr:MULTISPECIES: flagellar motor switch protein FliN [unclassified Rhizobium]KQY17739.1 flagellar motor switch protein FliN [Rhizobium sp. Root1334]KRC13605.1 flagellar motor switch protein FliN [Rhizobium sp. Root73]